MRKISLKRLFLSLLSMALLLVVWTVPAQAGSVTKICDYISKNKTVYRDITGDGKKDTIRFKLSKNRYDCIGKVQIYVNGKKALTTEGNEDYNYGITVNHIFMSKKRQLLQIYRHTDNDYVYDNNIYEYNSRTGKLKKVISLDKTYMNPGDAVSASKSQIKVYYKGQPSETGWLTCEMTYVYKNGRYKLKSSIAPVKSMIGSGYGAANDNYGKYFAKNQFKVANKRTFYTSTKMTKKSFTAKRGDVLTLKKIRITSDAVYLQFKKGSKTGWQKVFTEDAYDYSISDWENIGNTGWFYGVFNRLAG